MSEVKIKVIDRDGQLKIAESVTDMNLNMMEAIHMNEITDEGTIGVCGGIGMCASCQCYIEEGAEHLPEKNDTEVAMLLEAQNVQPNSRLACQIPVTKELENVTFKLAPAEEWDPAFGK